MRGTPYSKTCNRTCRRFYDDFDLLPPEIKKLLHEQNRMPTFEDLKAAWELAQETITLKDILDRVRVIEEDRRNKKEAQARAEKARLDRINALRTRRIPVYQERIVHTGKHARLIARVSEIEAVRLLSRREENADIRPAGPVIVHEFVGWRPKADVPPPRGKERHEPRLHLCKALHNA